MSLAKKLMSVAAAGIMLVALATGFAGGVNVQAQTPAPAAAPALDITGTWQGTLHLPNRDLRLIIKVTKADNGTPAVQMYSIDQGAQPFKASSVSLDGSNFKFTIDMIGGSYNGKLSEDKNTLTGTWTQGPGQAPTLIFVRPTKQTAWEIPAPPPPPKLMPADADPSFEVATIKPNNSGANSMRGLHVNGRNFSTNASSLVDLITFSYEVESKQIIGLPGWADTDRFDIAAVPDVDGMPSPTQLRSMIKKLLAERFNLKIHIEKKDMSAYVLSVDAGGSKMTPTQMKGPLPGLGFRPAPNGLTFVMMNGSISEMTGILQVLALDRPVVDHTGLTGKYDVTCTFTPDDTMFHGHPPMPPASQNADTANAAPAPSMAKAFQEKLGLKLEIEKTPVDVIVVDHVDKVSDN